MKKKIIANPAKNIPHSAQTKTVTRAERLQQMQSRVMADYIKPYSIAHNSTTLNILDFGIGDSGAPTFFELFDLLKHCEVRSNLFGIDISDEVISLARARKGERHKNVTLLVSDFSFNRLPGIPKFDFVFLSNVLTEYNEESAIIKHFQNCLQPDGRLIVSKGPYIMDRSQAPNDDEFKHLTTHTWCRIYSREREIDSFMMSSLSWREQSEESSRDWIY